MSACAGYVGTALFIHVVWSYGRMVVTEIKRLVGVV